MSAPAPVPPRQTTTGKYKKGIKTGIDGWEQYIETDTGRSYFRNHQKGLSSWGLPLRDVLRNPGVKGPTGSDDWECFIDSETQRRFYESKKLKKVQWRVPHVYNTTIGKMEFFSNDYAEKQRLKLIEKRKAKALVAKQRELEKRVLQEVKITQVLNNSVLCAAFHRFLISVYAEENLLFYGAVQIFEKGIKMNKFVAKEFKCNKGSFHGMNIMGIENELTDDEGAEFLQSQLVQSRASKRIGLPLERISLKAEDLRIYEKFLSSNSELWVCVDQNIANHVKEQIDAASDTDDIRGVFQEAEREVLHSMSNDLMPRFLATSMNPTKEEIAKTGFKPDQLLQRALISLIE